jgi:hypothetical protein
MSVYLDHVNVDAIRIHRVKSVRSHITKLKADGDFINDPPSSYITMTIEQDDGSEPVEILLFVENEYLDQVKPPTI